MKQYDHGEFNVFHFNFQPGTSILAFYERENGLQMFCQTNYTNAPIELVFYVYGVLWFRVEAGIIGILSFYTMDGPYGVRWNSVNSSIGFGTNQLSSWSFGASNHLPFELLRAVDYRLVSDIGAVVNMEFYYQNYQFNIGGLDFK